MDKNDLKIGLTLSGGGVRAIVFHLGVLSRLADEKLLEKIQMISTVSGGSLLLGMIYQSNGNKWPSSDEFHATCLSFVKNCILKRNLQFNIILRTLFWPFPYFGKGRASIVAASLRKCWELKAGLNDLAEYPRWIINGTAIESGKCWQFIPNKRMGDYILNYAELPDLSLSQTLGASAGVPMLLGPLTIKTSNYKWFSYGANNQKIEHKPIFKRLHIWDGGAYDNLGVESIVKFQKNGNGLIYKDDINFLIVSDAALEINIAKRKWYNAMRLIDVTMDQVRALRARILWNHFQNSNNSGVYFKIGETVEKVKKNHNCNLTLTKKNLRDERVKYLKSYPTTLWRMKETDFKDLFDHGWEVANAALVCQSPQLFNNID